MSVRHEFGTGKQVRHELGRRTSEAQVFTRGTETTSETQIFTWGIGRRKHEARYSIIHLLRHVPHLSADREMPHLSTRSASRRLSENMVFDHLEFFDESQILLRMHSDRLNTTFTVNVHIIDTRLRPYLFYFCPRSTKIGTHQLYNITKILAVGKIEKSFLNIFFDGFRFGLTVFLYIPYQILTWWSSKDLARNVKENVSKFAFLKNIFFEMSSSRR